MTYRTRMDMRVAMAGVRVAIAMAGVIKNNAQRNYLSQNSLECHTNRCMAGRHVSAVSDSCQLRPLISKALTLPQSPQ
jgi:hypothetical protein